MPNKPILDIEVNDENFKAFKKLFDEYSAKLEDMPDEWKKVQKALDAASGSLAKHIARVHQQGLVTGAKEGANLAKHLASALKSQKEFNTETKRAGTAMRRLGDDARQTFRDISHGVRAIAGFTGKTLGIAGLITTGGVLGVDALAASTLRKRFTARELGVPIGEAQAFANVYQRVLPNPTGFAEKIATMRSSYEFPRYLAPLGISPEQAKSLDTVQLSELILRRSRKLWRAHPNVQSAEAYGLTKYLSVPELRMLGNTPGGSFGAMQAQVARETAGLNIPPAVAAQWAALKTQLGYAGGEIETVLVRGLASVAPQIGQLSTALADVLRGLFANGSVKTGLEDMAAWLKTYAIPDIKEFAASLKSASGVISKIIHPERTLAHTAAQMSAANRSDADRALLSAVAKTHGGGPGTSYSNLGFGRAAWAQSAYDKYRKLYAAKTLRSISNTAEHVAGLPAGSLWALAGSESSYGAQPFSASGTSFGAWQVLKRPGITYADLLNPAIEAPIAAAILRRNYKRFGSWNKAFAAYNMGAGGLSRLLKAHPHNWLAYAPETTQRDVVLGLGSAADRRAADPYFSRQQSLPAALANRIQSDTANVQITIRNETAARISVSGAQAWGVS